MKFDTALKIAAIIVGAGSGSRASAGLDNGKQAVDPPKQFVELGGKTLFQWSVDAFASLPKNSRITCVVPPYVDPSWELPHSEQNERVLIQSGGETRQLSVYAGLQRLASLGEWDVVLIHDAARPFVSSQTILSVIEDAAETGGAIAAIPVYDSLKRATMPSEKPMVLEGVERGGMYQAQTPQGFCFAQIKRAHEIALAMDRVDYSDDAGLYEEHIGPVALSKGHRNNWKITSADDLFDAGQVLSARRRKSMRPDIRTGHGYDVHAFEVGDHVTLCGVDLPFDRGLKGHSDADVGLHALTDAIYGALAEGDIGHHFPPSDDQWKAARSDVFLRHATDRAKARGAEITHLDVTLICEAPKIDPHRESMRERICAITELDPARVSVKATTSERLGFTGRREGIAATATATLVFNGEIQ